MKIVRKLTIQEPFLLHNQLSIKNRERNYAPYWVIRLGFEPKTPTLKV